MVVLSRIIAASVYAGAAFLFGIALGERGELGAVQYIFLAVIPAATIILGIFARRGRPEVFFTGLAMFIGLYIGQLSFATAFAECQLRANAMNRILAALAEYRERTGDYPPHLRDLEIELPCNCVLRKSIVHYAANDRGVKLWITNDVKTISLPTKDLQPDHVREKTPRD